MTPLARTLFDMGTETTQRLLAEANAEVDHRMSPEELDEYARALDRAQRKLGVREIVLNPGDF